VEYPTRHYNGGSILTRARPNLVDGTRYVTGATIRDVERDILVRKSIYPRFDSDADKKLLWSTVEVIADGL